MLGPADIEDMMLDLAEAEAEAEAAASEQNPPLAKKWPPTSLSWGMGPTWDQKQTSLAHTPRSIRLFAASGLVIKHQNGKI
jgi:hypothetical protein